MKQRQSIKDQLLNLEQLAESIKQLKLKKVSRADILKTLNITYGLYNYTICRFNLKRKYSWTREEVEILCKMKEDGCSNKAIAKKLGRAYSSVRSKGGAISTNKRKNIEEKYNKVPVKEELRRFLARLHDSYRIHPSQLVILTNTVAEEYVQSYNASIIQL